MRQDLGRKTFAVYLNLRVACHSFSGAAAVEWLVAWVGAADIAQSDTDHLAIIRLLTTLLTRHCRLQAIVIKSETERLL